MTLKVLPCIISLAAFASFLSLYMLSTIVPRNSSPPSVELRSIEASMEELKEESKKLKVVIDGLSSGRLSHNDPAVLSAIRSRSDGSNKLPSPQSLQNVVDLERITNTPIILAPNAIKESRTKQQSHSKRYSELPSLKQESVVNNGTIPSILVVGGTDGSGTRRVVQVLSALGVKMVSEDPQTYDIHADIVGGWPTIVNPVIQATHRLSYEPSQLSNQLYSATVERITKLINKAREDAKKPQSFTLAVGGLLRRPPKTTAYSVEFGFKAPVSMTLLPFWAEVAPHLKFLHVVRDGRDIAFSANQGPVEKFYEAMYGQERTERHPAVRGIRLWSDWNSQILSWAHQRTKDENQTRSLSYMLLHTEDLVPYSSSLDTRFQAMKRLALWVGSSLADAAICCLALAKSSFMGSHDGTDSQRGQDSLKGRYGKWKEQVRVNPRLGELLNEAGGEGLKMLKYEPYDANYAVGYSPSSFQCTVDVPCPKPAPVIRQGKNILGKVEIAGAKCVTHEGVDYKGGGFDIEEVPGSNIEECCRLCKETKNCKYVTMLKGRGVCFLKSGKGTFISDETTMNLISADLVFI